MFFESGEVALLRPARSKFVRIQTTTWVNHRGALDMPEARLVHS